MQKYLLPGAPGFYYICRDCRYPDQPRRVCMYRSILNADKLLTNWELEHNPQSPNLVMKLLDYLAQNNYLNNDEYTSFLHQKKPLAEYPSIASRLHVAPPPLCQPTFNFT